MAFPTLFSIMVGKKIFIGIFKSDLSFGLYNLKVDFLNNDKFELEQVSKWLLSVTCVA